MASPLFLAFSLLPIRLLSSSSYISSYPFFFLSPLSHTDVRVLVCFFPGTHVLQKGYNLPKGMKEKNPQTLWIQLIDSQFHSNAILCCILLCCCCHGWRVVLDCPAQLSLFCFQHSLHGFNSFLVIVFHWYLILAIVTLLLSYYGVVTQLFDFSVFI